LHESVRASHARVRTILFNARGDRERELDFIYDGVRLAAAYEGVRTLSDVRIPRVPARTYADTCAYESLSNGRRSLNQIRPIDSFPLFRGGESFYDPSSARMIFSSFFRDMPPTMVVISDYPTRPIMFVEIKFEREGGKKKEAENRKTVRKREQKRATGESAKCEQSPCTVSDVVQGLEVFIRDTFETAGIGD